MTSSIEILTLSSAAALILGVTVGLWTDDSNPYSAVQPANAEAPVKAVRAVHRVSTVEPCPSAAEKARYQRPLRPRV